MPNQFQPPVDADSTARPLPSGWVQQYDPARQTYFYVDTMTLNPQATWVDPRENPSLYSSHDPSLGVTVHRRGSEAGSSPASAPPASILPIKKYPDYPPKASPSAPFLALVGATIAGGMLYTTAEKTQDK